MWMPPLAHWVHDLDPFIFRFPDSWPLEGLRWYGMAYAAGFAVAYWLLHLYYKKGRSPLDPDQQANLMTAVIIGALVGGRLGYKLLYDWGNFVEDPLSLLRIWEGGMASHGGFIGVILALIVFSWRTGQNRWRLGDIAATLTPPGLLFGRLANFINGELWGKVSNVRWAVIFPDSAPSGIPVEMIAPRHPSQLYEAALEGLFLLLYTQWRFWRGKDLRVGQLGGEFLLLYALVRILGEQFREPDAALILGMSRGIFYSLFMVLVGLVLIALARQREERL